MSFVNMMCILMGAILSIIIFTLGFFAGAILMSCYNEDKKNKEQNNG